MSDIETFKELVQGALEHREETKVYKDMLFLRDIFQKKIPLFYRAKKLADIYSVARTLNKNLTGRDYKDLLNSLAFKNFSTERDINTQLEDLLQRTEINEKQLGSKKNKNKIVSFLSKYGYYCTERNFPIYDSYAEKYMKRLYKKFNLKKIGNNDKYIAHFLRYKNLLNHLSTENTTFGKNHTLIDGIDAFLWLYGIMEKAEKDAKKEASNSNEYNKKEKEELSKILYSATCGDLTKFTTWYNKAKNFMQNNKQ